MAMRTNLYSLWQKLDWRELPKNKQHSVASVKPRSFHSRLFEELEIQIKATRVGRGDQQIWGIQKVGKAKNRKITFSH